MKRFAAILLLGTLVAVLGACTPRPLTDSEFRGFCYTALPGRNADCDTIPLCDTYDTEVLSTHHASRAACAQACSNTYDQLYRQHTIDGCKPTEIMAYNWCMKYCNTNYPQ